MSPDLRARIERAYDEGGKGITGNGRTHPVIRRDMRVAAILAALPEADRGEVADVVYDARTEAPGSEWHITDALREHFYLIPKGENDA